MVAVSDGVYPRVAAFRDVLVTPYASLFDLAGGEPHDGGPIRPDRERADFARFRLHGELRDVRPAPSAPAERVATGPWFWIGPVHPHYGHAIVDFLTRIRPTLEARPDARLVFATRADAPLASAADPPRFHREIIAWHGAAPDAVKIVSRPTLFASLGVAAQPETSCDDHQGAPHEGHLDALSSLSRRRVGVRRRSGALFVSRSSQRNGFAGERRLDDAFAAAGVDVLVPETLPLEAQIERLMSAALLIFSEGSAAHTLQLCGRDFGDVVMLRRRAGASGFAPGIVPRAASYAEIPAARRFVSGLLPNGHADLGGGLSLIDVEALLSAMDRAGVDLRSRWDADRFAAAEAADLRLWARTIGRRSLDAHPGSLRPVLSGLARSGVAGARREAALLAAWSLAGRAPGPVRDLCVGLVKRRRTPGAGR